MASFVLRAGARAPRIDLGVREKCPGLPNLRDHGLTVDRELLRILRNLQRRHGYGSASEDTLRAMFFQDTGHMPGVGTIAAALLRLELLGLCESRWIHRGGTRPDGTIATVGCRRLRLAESRNERRLIASRARRVDRRENISGRTTFAVPAFQAKSPPPAAADDDREQAYERSIARSLEWLKLQGDG